MTLTTKPDFADIEVRVFPCQERGYPVEITLDGQQEFRAGYLAEAILPWVSSGEAGRDGRRLFEAFLSDPALRSAWGEARGRASRRRIRLRIDPAAAELHEIPWELLNEDNVMLSAGEQTPFSRYLPVALPWGSTAEERPIRILVAISNPDDLQAQYNLQQLDVARERKTLESALAEAGATVEMHFLEAPLTLERLEEELRQGYHILHYLGHGAFSARRGQAALYLQNSDGHTQVVNDEAVIGMLARQQKHPSLVFLAACQSAARSTADAFLGFAPKLVAAGVPAVVAMQDFVDVETARKLGAVFYQRLAEHGTVDRALNEARSVLLTASRPDAAVPVLFMRLKSGQLWSPAAEARDQGKTLQGAGGQAFSGPAGLRPILAVPPSPPRNFTGRRSQIARIAATLTDAENPVVAILGMGGIGKTALVKQVIAEVGPKFPGGFFWGDELPPKDSNPHIILKQWGRLCGQNLEKESEENLPAAIRGLLTAYRAEFGNLLVIVDDVRLDWTSDGVDTIRQALPPGIPLLITTRQAQIAQELDAKIFNLDVFSRAESSQLLLALSEGKITPAQAGTFAELCGDMPLALELMAKLTKRRKSEWLLERLQDETGRLDLLKLDDARKKEQSVRISFELNYQSLAEQYPESARLFRSLAAFARPAFIILEHLTGTIAKLKKEKTPTGNSEKSYQRAAEDDLLRLVDWSLLAEESLNGSEMQYFHLHTLLHEYAQSLLKDEAELEAAAQTQIRYCIAFAEANPQIDLQTQCQSTHEFEKSYGQLSQALKQLKERYLVEGSGWEQNPELARQVIALVESMDYHWQWHNRFADQMEWLPVAYLCAGTRNDPLKQADFARRLGRVLSWQGQLEEASAWMERCQAALGEDASEAANAIRALMFIHSASIRYQQSAIERAEEKCQHGLDLVSAQKQPKTYAEGCNLMGAIKLRTGNLAAAQKAFEQSLTLWQQVGDQYQVKRVGDNLRATLRRLGDLAQMRKIEDEILQYWEKFPNNIHFAMALTNHGQTLGNDGEYEAAIELQQRAMSISDLLGVQRIRALVRVNLAWSLIALGKYDEAEGYLKESLVIQTEFKTTESWVEAQRGLAAVALGRKLGAQAVELAQIALQLAREEHDRLEEGATLRVLGQAYQLNGDLVQSREQLENSLALLRENGYKYESLLTLQALSKLYETLGEAKAQVMNAEVRTLAEEMGLSLPD